MIVCELASRREEDAESTRLSFRPSRSEKVPMAVAVTTAGTTCAMVRYMISFDACKRALARMSGAGGGVPVQARVGCSALETVPVQSLRRCCRNRSHPARRAASERISESAVRAEVRKALGKEWKGMASAAAV